MDLRDLELIDVAELVKGSEFKVFTDWATASDGPRRRAPEAASLSRKQIDELRLRRQVRQGPGIG